MSGQNSTLTRASWGRVMEVFGLKRKLAAKFPQINTMRGFFAFGAVACTDLIDRLRICAAARFLGHASPATEPTPPVSGDSTSPAAPPASASSLPDAPVQS